MGELLPSKANPTEAQTMEYFQWDNKRPGFCVQKNLVQQSYHLLSDTISDHSEYDIYALHPSHNRRWEGGGNISCFLPNSIHSLLPQSDPLFGPFEPCFTFCASRGDDDVDADGDDGDDIFDAMMMMVVVVVMLMLMMMVMVMLGLHEDNSN